MFYSTIQIFKKILSNPPKLHEGILDLQFFAVIQLLWATSLAKSKENLFFNYFTASIC